MKGAPAPVSGDDLLAAVDALKSTLAAAKAAIDNVIDAHQKFVEANADAYKQVAGSAIDGERELRDRILKTVLVKLIGFHSDSDRLLHAATGRAPTSADELGELEKELVGKVKAVPLPAAA